MTPAQHRKKNPVGFVSIVGAGPGDPKLLTVKGQEVLQQAEVILVDRLVSKFVLEAAAPAAKVIYAGKSSDGAHASFKAQIAINEKLVKLAQEGLRVVRLKGGDPILFGRGAEEAEALAAKNIPFEIIPGIPSAIAAPAYAGIPVTHREFASSVAMVTGHERVDAASEKLPAAQADTLVYLMAVKTLPRVVAQLLQSGWPAKTPAALVEWGTCPWQRTVTATLATIEAKAKAEDIKPPAALVIGEVVRMRKKIAWFEKLPLLGRRILITRPASSSSDLRDRLMAMGADVDCVPAIALKALKTDDRMREAVKRLPETDWVFFSSPEGVRFFIEKLKSMRKDIRVLAGCHIGAVGRKTGEVLNACGLHVDFIPKKFSQDGILNDFPKRKLEGKRAEVWSAKKARATLAEGLRSKGMEVEQIALYDTVMPGGFIASIRKLMDKPYDWVTVTSSSCVEHLHAAFGSEVRKFKQLPFASIGPVTSAAVKDHGGTVKVEAAESTVDGLLRAIQKDASKKGGRRK